MSRYEQLRTREYKGLSLAWFPVEGAELRDDDETAEGELFGAHRALRHPDPDRGVHVGGHAPRGSGQVAGGALEGHRPALVSRPPSDADWQGSRTSSPAMTGCGSAGG